MIKLLSNTWNVILQIAALACLFNLQNFVHGQEVERKLENVDSTKSVKTDSELPVEKTAVPDWFVSDARYVTETKMGFIKTADSYLTREEAKSSLAEAARKMAKSVVERQLRISDSESLGLDGNHIIDKFLVEQRLAIVEDMECRRQAEEIGDDLKFYKAFAQVHFGESFDAYVQQKVDECRTQKRLIKSGLIGGSLLGLLAVAFGYFKMENATRGFYSRRLQTVSFLIAAAVVIVAYLISQQIV